VLSAFPPVELRLKELPAPTINLFLRSGVPLEPLQINHPKGIVFSVPDHIIIRPVGIINDILYILLYNKK
jgi:hypothetical protein